MLEILGLRERRPGLGQQRRRDDRHLGAAVVQEVQIVRGAHQRIRGDRNRADLDGAPERADELGRVQAQHQHAVLGLDADLEQRVARSIDQIENVRVGERAVFVAKRRHGPAAFGDVAVDEPRRGVELRGQQLRRVHALGEADVLEVDGPAVDAARWGRDPVGETGDLGHRLHEALDVGLIRLGREPFVLARIPLGLAEHAAVGRHLDLREEPDGPVEPRWGSRSS